MRRRLDLGKCFHLLNFQVFNLFFSKKFILMQVKCKIVVPPQTEVFVTEAEQPGWQSADHR
ncbi:hypothetical protein APED_04230 [Acanthopleuribacter pedis]